MKKGKVSTTGYRANSKDKDNAFNIIPSNRISMKNVNFPVLGTDDLGNEQMMMPGEEYSFPGQYVVEVPYKKQGGNTNSMKNLKLKEAYPQQPTMNQFFGITFNPMSPVGFYQQGGQPQQGGPDQMMQEVAQALQQGMPPEQIMQSLVQNGVPQQEAQQVIQMVMQQMQGQDQGASQMPDQQMMQPGMMKRGGQPCMDCGGEHMMPDGSMMKGKMKSGGDNWIQGAVNPAHKGRCTPGSPNFDCPKGSPQWNLAQTFRKMAKKQFGGSSALQNSDGESVIDNRNNTMKNFLSQNTMRALAMDEADNVAGSFMQDGGSPYYGDMYGQSQFQKSGQQGMDQMRQEVGDFAGDSYNLAMGALNARAQQNDQNDAAYWASQIKDPNAQQSYPQPIMDNSMINPSSEVQGIDYSQSFASQMRRGGNVRKMQPGGTNDIYGNFQPENAYSPIWTRGIPQNFRTVAEYDKAVNEWNNPAYTWQDMNNDAQTEFDAEFNVQTPTANPVVVGNVKTTTSSSKKKSNSHSTSTGSSNSNSSGSGSEQDASESDIANQTAGYANDCERLFNTQAEVDKCVQERMGNAAATTTTGTTTTGTGTRTGNYDEPAADQDQGSYQQLPNGQFMYMPSNQSYNMFPANFNPYTKIRGRGPMWQNQFPTMAYNPANTYLDKDVQRSNIFGNKRKMVFSHGYPTTDANGNVVNQQGTNSGRQGSQGYGNQRSNENGFQDYMEQNMNNDLLFKYRNGQLTPEGEKAFAQQEADLRQQYSNKVSNRLGNVQPWKGANYSREDRRTMKQESRPKESRSKESNPKDNLRRNPLKKQLNPVSNFNKRPMQFGGNPNASDVNQSMQNYDPYANSYGKKSKIVIKDKLGMNPEDAVAWGLTGANAFASVLESGKAYRDAQIAKSRMGADATHIATQFGDTSRGDYDPNTGNFQATRQGQKVKDSGYDVGQIASGNTYAKQGGSPYSQDQEYYLTEREIAEIESMGGTVQYLD